MEKIGDDECSKKNTVLCSYEIQYWLNKVEAIIDEAGLHIIIAYEIRVYHIPIERKLINRQENISIHMKRDGLCLDELSYKK